MPPGPSSTTAPFYLPAGYHMSAFPAYSKIATHQISTAQYSHGGTIEAKAGLHSKPAKVEVDRVHWKDLEKKEELLDYLDGGIDVIVFNEACGYHGQWSEVIVINGPNEFYKYESDDGEVKRQFILNSNLLPLTGIPPSHPMVEPSQIKSFNYNILPSPWRNKTPEVPFYDTRTANISVVVERDPTVWAADENTQTLMRKALEEGLRIIFEHYQKEIPEGLFPELEFFSYWGAEGYDKFFIFARAEEFHLEARPNAPLKVLVTIPQKYFDTYDVKEESKYSISKFKDDTAEAKATLNKYLDSNSGLINTNVLRELLPDEYVREQVGDLANLYGIFGEEIVWLSADQQDILTEAIVDPEALSARSEERLAQANEEIGSLPESYYEKYVSEDIRESIENTIDTVADALAELETDAGDVTAATQNVIDIVNTVQQTLGAAPEYDETNQALMSSLTDPTVSMGDLTGTFEKEIAKRRSEDQDLDVVLSRIEGTLLARKYRNLMNKFGAAVKEVALLANPSFQPIHKAEKSQKAKENQRATLQAVKHIEKTIKKVKFYVQLSTDQFKEGTDQLKKILEYLEESKDQFQGEVKGWSPYADANRITEAYDEIVKYINDQGENKDPKKIIEWKLGADDDYWDSRGGVTIPYVELAFTNAHSLVYIGYSYLNTTTQKWLTMHRYNTGQMLPTPPRPSPLDSETIMAYVWKLNDIVNDPLSNYLMGKPLPLTRWGLKYVYPRPTFIPKARTETDISDERHKNKTLLNQLDEKEMQLHRKNAEKVARIALEATYAIEEPIDTVVASSNEAIRYVNRTDDWINNFFESVSTNDPYSAALVKCLVPNLDFDLLPEIPDFDLQFLRNPILKLLELYNLLSPKGDLLQGIIDGLVWALEQALKIIYATAIKLLLETLTALCLQFQAGLLEAIAAGLSPSPVELLSEGAASSGGGAMRDVSIDGASTGTRAALRDSATLNSFKEIGVFPLQGFHEADSIRMIKDLFVDVSGMLTAVEICQLTSANPPNHVVDIIKSLIKLKHSHFIDHLNNKSKIIDLFAAFGKYVDQKLCDDIITANESNTIYNSNYKDLYCNTNTELDQARKSLLSCNPNLTEEMIDDIVARENKNNLEVARNLINNYNSDTIKDLLQPLSLENDAIDFVNGTAIEAMFAPVDTALKRELKEFPPHMYDLAARSLSQDNGVFDEIPTELMTSLREQCKNIESNEVFQILEEDDGFVIKLLSPASFVNGSDKKFELLYKLYNRKSPRTDQVFPEFVEGIVPTASPTTDNIGKDKYSLILRNPEVLLNGEIMNIFKYTKKFDPPIFVKNYIEQNFQNVDLTVTNATPQQIYFSKFLLSKLPSGTQLSAAQHLALPIERTGGLSLFLQYGVFSQITRDIIAFLGRKVADSKYFEVSPPSPPSPTGTSNLELLELSSFDFLNLEKIKSEALKKFKKNYYDDLPEPRDGTIQRENYNSFEVANLEQCIKTIIKVYILEFFIKSIFSSSAFKLSEETEEVLYDYILKRMERDIPAQFSRIFNYKFFYLARGVYQDNLEAPIEGSDLFYKKAIKKYIIEEYKGVADTFNWIVKGSTMDVIKENKAQSSTFPTTILAGLNIELVDPSQASTATREFMGRLPIHDLKPHPTQDGNREYQNSMDFIINKAPDLFIEGTLKLSDEGRANISSYYEVSKNFKNGNFYFERYLKITYEDGTSKIIAPNDFQYDSSVSAISYGLRLVYLFPYGSLHEKGVKVTESEGITTPIPKYLIDLDEVSQNFEKILFKNHFAFGDTADDVAGIAVKKHLHVVTMANVEYQYKCDVEDFYNAFYVFAEKRGSYYTKQLTDEKYPKKYGNYWAIDGMVDGELVRQKGDSVNAYSSFKEALLNEINIIADTPQRREILAKEWETNTLGIGVLVRDGGGTTFNWQSNEYWSSRGMSSTNEVYKKRKKQADKAGGSFIQDYTFLKKSTESIEEYIDRHLKAFFKAYAKWLNEGDQEGYDSNFNRTRAWAILPKFESYVIGNRFPETDLSAKMNKDKNVNFLFNYIFPIEKYKTLMSIYNVETMDKVPGLDMMFSETKDALRTLFNVIDSRGRFNYTGPTNIDNIRKKKEESRLPTVLLPGLDIELEFGEEPPEPPAELPTIILPVPGPCIDLESDEE